MWSIQKESGNRRESIQKSKRPSSNGPIKMHSKGVNVSSEMIKEMGIRILDRVNEMYPDGKKIHVAFSNGPFIDVNAHCARSW